MDNHKDDPLPFDIGIYKSRRHLLNHDSVIFLSTTIQKAEIILDRELIISDYINTEYTIH